MPSYVFFIHLLGLMLLLAKADDHANCEACPVNDQIQIDDVVNRHITALIIKLVVDVFARVGELLDDAGEECDDLGDEVFHGLVVLSFYVFFL